MAKLAGYIKPYIIPLICAIGFLALQAYGELTLPEVMSRLVDVGISRSGIESAAPEAVRESEMAAIMRFVGESDRALVTDNYRLLSRSALSEKDYNKYVKKYSSLANENIYMLDTNDKTVLAALEPVMGMAVIINGYEKTLSGGAQLTGDMAMFTQLDDAAVLQMAIPFIVAEYEAVGIDMEKYPTSYIIGEGGYMLLLAMLIMVSVIVVAFLSGRIGAGIGRDLRRDMFDKIVSFSSAEFDKFSTASLITRSTNDIQQIQSMLGFLMRIVIYAPIMGIGGIIKVLHTEASMSWIIALAVGIMMIMVLIMFTVAIPKFKLVQKLIDRVNLVMREALSGILVIRAFSNQKYERDKFYKANRELTDTNLFVARVMALMMPMMMIVMNGVSLLIVWIGASKIDAGLIEVGDMMAFISYSMQIIIAFLMISVVSMMLPRAMVSGKRIVEVLSTDNSIHDPKTDKPFVDSKKGYVEFKNVSFKYPAAEDNVLQDISFTAKPGETTAFIGSTGSGKTTILSIIQRFYDVTEGAVFVNGTDIRDVKQHNLRDQIGYIPQNGVLFSGTIRSNIAFGRDSIEDGEVKDALEIAQALDFVEEKPDKYDEAIAQGGTNVSGGQKQRLSIARAIAKKSPIYLFDDSFSALDYKTDSRLRRAINERLSGSTILVVAQRIGTIKNAEQIIVMDQGLIVGKGTHKELLRDCEEYRQIALSQLSQEEIDKDLAEGGYK